jgi:transposase-like protein
MRNVVNKVKKKDQKEVKAGAVKIYLAENRREAIKNFWEWAKRWREIYPKAVECIEKDLEELLSFLKVQEEHKESHGKDQRCFRRGSFKGSEKRERVLIRVPLTLTERAYE